MCGAVKNKTMQNKELAEELHKPITRKFEKWKVHSPFIDNIWGSDLADMQLLTKFNNGICFLLCLLIFMLSIYRFFLWRIWKVLRALMLFKKH